MPLRCASTALPRCKKLVARLIQCRLVVAGERRPQCRAGAGWRCAAPARQRVTGGIAYSWWLAGQGHFRADAAPDVADDVGAPDGALADARMTAPCRVRPPAEDCRPLLERMAMLRPFAEFVLLLLTTAPPCTPWWWLGGGDGRVRAQSPVAGRQVGASQQRYSRFVLLQFFAARPAGAAAACRITRFHVEQPSTCRLVSPLLSYSAAAVSARQKLAGASPSAALATGAPAGCRAARRDSCGIGITLHGGQRCRDRPARWRRRAAQLRRRIRVASTGPGECGRRTAAPGVRRPLGRGAAHERRSRAS